MPVGGGGARCDEIADHSGALGHDEDGESRSADLGTKSDNIELLSESPTQRDAGCGCHCDAASGRVGELTGAADGTGGRDALLSGRATQSAIGSAKYANRADVCRDFDCCRSTRKRALRK